MNKLLSVIIPCYNVERYIERCLDSVLNQTYNNIEVITIDDGSTDSTAELIQSYLTDGRLKYVSQTRNGVSAARNRGLELASGEMIAFVDGDDWLELNMYEKLSAAMSLNDADIAVCNYNLVYEDRTDYQYSKIRNENVNVSDDIYLYFCKYCACQKPNNYIWSRLYRSGVIKSSRLKFHNYTHSEDTLFNFMLLPHIKRITFLEDGLYNYFQHPGSAIRNLAATGNIAQIYTETFEALANYYEKIEFYDYANVLMIHAFTRIRSVFFYSRLAGKSDEEIVLNIVNDFKGRKIAQYLTGVMK